MENGIQTTETLIQRRRMNATYQLDRHSERHVTQNSKHALEICAKLLHGHSPSTDHWCSLMTPDTTLFVQGDLKGYSDPLVGYDPASNFRDKEKVSNNQIIENWMNLFEIHRRVHADVLDSGIVCTSIPRSERYFTIKMHDDGMMKVHHNSNDSVNSSSTEILQNFLDYNRITPGRVLLMRESSKGARYRTYFADLQAFVLAVNFREHPEMFEEVFMTPTIVSPGDNELFSDGSTKPILRERDLPHGKKWTPKDMNYLYFVESKPGEKKHCPHSQKFYRPKAGSVKKVYYQIDELLKNEENGMKKMVRNYFSNLGDWTRWSDYWVNDVDDAVTILAIRHAYSFCDPDYSGVMETLDGITKPWYEHFASQELLNMEPEPEPEY